MRSVALVFFGFLIYTSTAFPQNTVEVSVTNFEGLQQQINLANQRPSGTLTIINIPEGSPIYVEEPPILPVESNIHIKGGKFLESQLDGATSQAFVVYDGASLTVEGSEFVDWSHVGVGPTPFWNQGELVLKDVTISSIYGAGIFSHGCRTHTGAVIENEESGTLTMENVRITDSGGQPLWCGGEPGNGFLRNKGHADIDSTTFFLSDNDWEWPIYNSGVLIVRDSEFVVDNGEEEPSLSLVYATEPAQTEFINSIVQGFKDGVYSLSNGGANGLYYDAEHNGHYVYVLDNDYNTLVVWNTFDTDGNQAWVLAIGTLVNGRSMTAKAYINENGMLTENGPVNVDLDRFWGTMQLDLVSCDGGTMSFSSALPNFTSGEFRIWRLASVKQVGCQD